MSKVILISGASTGIGRAAAHYFAKKGHQVFAGVRKNNITFDVPGITPVLLDVCDQQSMQNAIQQVAKATNGKIDYLINNAGIGVIGPLEGIGVAALEQQLKVNILGVYELTRLVLPYLKVNQGRVANIGSVSGLFATPISGAYCVSKYAIEALSDSWRRELKSRGVHIALIEPGPIQSEIWDKSSDWTIDPQWNQDQRTKFLNDYQLEWACHKPIVANAKRRAKSTDLVNKALDHALLSRRPKARYTVNGSRLFLRLISMLPERWVDSIFPVAFKLLAARNQTPNISLQSPNP